MKTALHCAILLAGVITFGAASWGQNPIQANIPFRFQVASTEMPPGEYVVRPLQSGSPVLILNNWDTHKSAMVLTSSAMAPTSDQRPRMIFRCGDGGCLLTEVWGATASGGVRLSHPRGKFRDGDHLAVVYFEPKPVRQ